ncbi:MAG: ammonia-forming cytochrome c nitrite reductase subunit c552 [Nitrospirae bacterium]|nr:MAG: ammonia-forming cytochrome c nitrite reductase subunit c552 [Nitrospirota bacterium]
MNRKAHIVLTAIFAVALLAGVYYTNADAVKPVMEKPANVATCYGCHGDIKDFHIKGKHSKVNCSNCHEALDKHLKDSSMKPVTRMEHAACGKCHREQYQSFTAVNLESRAKVEKATFKSRSPLFDKLMAPHGFTKEHDEPRSHVFMLVDHLIVDRGYGGRFQLTNWTKISDGKGAEKSAWDVLKDAEPATSDQKAFIPQSATAANSVCLQCKTQDNILKWAYMGDKNPKAKWDRTSKVVDLARDLKHPINCFACHDPHSAQPRVVRDGLIEAVVDKEGGTYPYDKEKSKKITMKKVMFRDFRAIGILSKPDSNLMCAQCHVEYNCNPGHNPETGEAVGMGDRRTNFFPWVNVFDYKAKMDEAKFRDFKHAVTGASIAKLQHPETETFWGSKHERAGVECKDCHMPKMKKAGKTYTWHGQKSARYMKKDTCVKCHPYWSEKEAEYQIDAIQNYIRGKLTKAEFWLGQLIDSYAKAKAAGVSDEILKEARQLHDQAHIYWEWWTAENSDGFHNPDAARGSLTRSIDASQKGIKLLSDAMAAAKTTPAKPAAK